MDTISFAFQKDFQSRNLNFFIHEPGHEIGFNHNYFPLKPIFVTVENDKIVDIRLDLKEIRYIKNCNSDKNYSLTDCIKRLQMDYLNRNGLKSISGCENENICWRPENELLINDSYEICKTESSFNCGYTLGDELAFLQVMKSIHHSYCETSKN